MGVRGCLGMGSTMSRFFLIIVNIVFALLGIGLVILGIYLRTNRAVDNRVIQLLRQTDVAGLNLGDVMMVMSVFIIIMGVFTVLVAAFGGFGACLRKKGLLIVYLIVLSLIFVIELALFIVWCKFAYGTNTWLKQQFDNLFRYYNGTRDMGDLYSKGWNLMFILLDCCGSNPISAFNNDFQRLGTYWWNNVPLRGFSVIPYSCCRDSNVQNYMAGVNPACQAQLQFHRTRGCYDALKQLITNVSGSAIGLTLILLIAEVLAFIAAVLIIHGINRETKQSMDTTNGSAYNRKSSHLPLPDTKPR